MTPDIRERAERLAGALSAAGCALPDRVRPTAEALISQALLEAHEAGMKAAFDLLNEPGALRANLLRGSIKAPDDLVWLHDTNGPVAAKVFEAHNAGRAEWLENSIGAIAAQLEEEMNKHGDEDMRAALGWQLFKDSQWLQERLATAIRSIK